MSVRGIWAKDEMQFAEVEGGDAAVQAVGSEGGALAGTSKEVVV